MRLFFPEGKNLCLWQGRERRVCLLDRFRKRKAACKVKLDRL